MLLETMLLACWACDPKPADKRLDPAAIERGRAQYLEHCALCHGERADGRGVRHSGLIGKPVDFTRRAWRDGVSRERVEQVIRDGKPGTSMAAWRTLGDDSIADLAAYVLSVSEGGP